MPKDSIRALHACKLDKNLAPTSSLRRGFDIQAELGKRGDNLSFGQNRPKLSMPLSRNGNRRRGRRKKAVPLIQFERRVVPVSSAAW